jgi:hypothetical protein
MTADEALEHYNDKTYTHHGALHYIQHATLVEMVIALGDEVTRLRASSDFWNRRFAEEYERAQRAEHARETQCPNP